MGNMAADLGELPVLLVSSQALLSPSVASLISAMAMLVDSTYRTHARHITSETLVRQM